MIGSIPIPGAKYTIGVGYIAIPSDLERDKYLKDCYLNNQVSIQTEDGGFFNRVPISPDILNFITFPLVAKEVGTPVVYGTDEIYQQPVILMRLQQKGEVGDSKENQFKFRRKLNGVLVEISGAADTGVLNLMVDGDDKSGQININLFNKNKDCELKLNIGGKIVIASSGSISFEQHGGWISETSNDETDDFTKIEQTDTEHRLKNKKLVINEGTDPLTLGNELKDFLSSFINEVSKITVATSIGQQPILNKVQILTLKEKLDSFLSQVAFIDK